MVNNVCAVQNLQWDRPPGVLPDKDPVGVPPTGIDARLPPRNGSRAIVREILSVIQSCSVVIGPADLYVRIGGSTETTIDIGEGPSGTSLTFLEACRLAEEIEDRVQGEYARAAEAEAHWDALFWEEVE